MTKNNKPILSILVDEQKKEKFADLARRNSLSMGWLVNQAIDRMLEADSIDIYRNSTSLSIESQEPVISTSSIDKMVKFSIENQLVGETRIYIEELIDTSIGKLDLETLVKTSVDSLRISSIGNREVEELVRAYIKPINESLNELETYTRNQLEAMRSEMKKALCGTIPLEDAKDRGRSIEQTTPIDNFSNEIPNALDETPRGGNTRHLVEIEDRTIEIGTELDIGDLKVLVGFGRNSTHKGLQPMTVGEEIELEHHKTKASIGRWQKLENAPRPSGGRPMQMFKKVAD